MKNNVAVSRFKIYISMIFKSLDYKQSDEIAELKKARKNKNVKNEEQARRLATDSRDMMDRFTKMRSKI